MQMYDQFIQRPVKPRQDAIVDFSNNIWLSPEMLKAKFVDIDNVTDKELYDLFVKYFTDILDSIFNQKDKTMIDLFTNTRFITIATQALYSIVLTDTQRKRCNKMAYDYIILKNEHKTEAVQDLLISFSKVVNKDIIPLLCGLGLTANVASMLALARYSSEKDVINVKRLNRVIMAQSSKIMTEQMVVNIYCKMFTRITPLFEGVMLDIVSCQNLNDNEAEIYGTISLAILDIANDLPMSLIHELLSSFIEDKQMLYPDSRLRFNLESFSPDDYPRISRELDNLKLAGVHIPTI